MNGSSVSSSPFAKHMASSGRANFTRTLVTLVLLVPMLLSGTPVAAQEVNAAQPAHRSAPRHKGQGMDERVEQLARYLDLNEGQRSALKSILLENQQEILKMRRAPSQGEELQIDRFRIIEDKTVEKIRAMLTEEQRKRYDPLGVRNSNSAAQNVSVEDWLKQTRPR